MAEAIRRVDEEYIHEDRTINDEVEHVFAYELYHQWSTLLCNDEHLYGERYIHIGNRYMPACIPDFTLDSDDDEQLIAVELKRWKAINEESVSYDLNKLYHLMKQEDGFSPYRYGVFITTFPEDVDINEVKQQLRKGIKHFLKGNRSEKHLYQRIYSFLYNGSDLLSTTIDAFA